MWKYKLDKESSVQSIKEKRKCVDINLGFLYQLNKWEELLRLGKEFKFYRFDEEGNINLLDKTEIGDISFSVILLLHGGNFYKIINENAPSCNIDKVNEFVYLLQRYENYSDKLITIYLNMTNSGRTLLFDKLDEVIKSYSS
jgi:hypothetical protein